MVPERRQVVHPDIIQQAVQQGRVRAERGRQVSHARPKVSAHSNRTQIQFKRVSIKGEGGRERNSSPVDKTV